MIRTCKYSGVQFEPKRRDQFYATASHRQMYWNEVAAKAREREGDLKLLRKNFQILEALNIKKGERRSVDKEMLLKQGYTLDALSRLVEFENIHCPSVFGYILLKSEDGNEITIVNPVNI